jgi:hypothetical protein
VDDFACRIVTRKNVGIGNVKFAPNFLDHGADEVPHAIFVGDDPTPGKQTGDSNKARLGRHPLDLAGQANDQDRFLSIQSANIVGKRRDFFSLRFNNFQDYRLLCPTSVVARCGMEREALESLSRQANDFASVQIFCIDSINRAHARILAVATLKSALLAIARQRSNPERCH